MVPSWVSDEIPMPPRATNSALRFLTLSDDPYDPLNLQQLPHGNNDERNPPLIDPGFCITNNLHASLPKY